MAESGLGHILQRTAEVAKEIGTEDPDKLRQAGVIDFHTIQKYLNFHFSVTLDLYGSEISTNAANFYTNGLKGRYDETKIEDDHKLQDAPYLVPVLKGDTIGTEEAPALNALNERLRDDYIVDCEKGIKRWNKILEKAEVSARMKLPHKCFHRRVGTFDIDALDSVRIDPNGQVISEADWTRKHTAWLPSHEDHDYVASLMVPVNEPGKFANWIAAPRAGIGNQPVEFEYVRV